MRIRSGISFSTSSEPEARRDNFDLMDFGICDSKICTETGRCLQIDEPRLWSDFESEEQN